MVTHEAPGDSFWDKVRAGAQAAAAKDNIDLKYSNDPTGPGEATLVQNAVDSKVDGIAVTLLSPDTMKDSMAAAKAAGIPTVAFNTGIKQYKDLGALMYFGSDEDIAGKAVGEKISCPRCQASAVHHPGAGLGCLGSPMRRCAGKRARDREPAGRRQGHSLGDLHSRREVAAGPVDRLRRDPGSADRARRAAVDRGCRQSAKLVTFDLNADVAKQVQDGKILFSVDQQPWLQGYMAVDSLWFYLTNKNDLGGGLPVLTGPSFVDATNIADILQVRGQQHPLMPTCPGVGRQALSPGAPTS